MLVTKPEALLNIGLFLDKAFKETLANIFFLSTRCEARLLLHLTFSPSTLLQNALKSLQALLLIYINFIVLIPLVSLFPLVSLDVLSIKTCFHPTSAFVLNWFEHFSYFRCLQQPQWVHIIDGVWLDVKRLDSTSVYQRNRNVCEDRRHHRRERHERHY